MADSWKDQVVIITGASMGIGEQMALQLARAGAKLVLAARGIEKLEAAAAQCRTIGAETLAVPTDISDETQAKALVEATIKHYGRIDTLINNAAIDQDTRLDEIRDFEIVRRYLATNTLGPVYLTLSALPHLKASKGRIGVMSSHAGRNGVPTKGIYSMSKFALDGFFKSLRIENRGTGLSISLVYLPFVSTGMHARALTGDGTPKGNRHNVDYKAAMTPEFAARKSLETILKRRRQWLATLRAQAGQWAQIVFPDLVDQLAISIIEKGR